MYNNFDLTCNFTSIEETLKFIEKKLFSLNNGKWIKDIRTKTNQIRYRRKYNELDLIEINFDEYYYCVLVPFSKVTYKLYFEHKSLNKMLDYVKKYI